MQPLEIKKFFLFFFCSCSERKGVCSPPVELLSLGGAGIDTLVVTGDHESLAAAPEQLL